MCSSLWVAWVADVVAVPVGYTAEYSMQNTVRFIADCRVSDMNNNECTNESWKLGRTVVCTTRQRRKQTGRMCAWRRVRMCGGYSWSATLYMSSSFTRLRRPLTRTQQSQQGWIHRHTPSCHPSIHTFNHDIVTLSHVLIHFSGSF